MRIAALGLAAMLVVGCVGPRPHVRSAEVASPEDGKATVTVVITNDGGGDGQVEVKVTLRDGERVVARDDKTTELKGRETLTLVMEISVPDDAGSLSVEAEAVYPPD